MNLAALTEDLRPYRRLLFLGAPGAGKSYVAGQVAQKLGLPLYNLDTLFWKKNWQLSTQEEFRAKVADVLATDRFVIDGNYSSSFRQRAEKADAVVMVEAGLLTRYRRILTRTFNNKGLPREGLPEGCGERLFSLPYAKFLVYAAKSDRAREKFIAESAACKIPFIVYRND